MKRSVWLTITLAALAGCSDGGSDPLVVLPRGRRNASYAFACDIVEVRRAATNYAAQRNDAVRATRSSDLVHRNRHLERAGDFDDIDVRVRGAVLPEAMQRSLEQRIHDKVVEPRRDDRESCIAYHQVAFGRFYFVHDGSLRMPGNQLSTYSVISRSKPEIAYMCLGADNTRIFDNPRSRRIWAPTP